jgi:hypothetical protein
MCFVLLSSSAQADLKASSFIGELITKFSSDGSYISLLQDFSFIDKTGKKWTAQKGLATDGASIPKIFWTVFGSPLKGKYVKGAVIHDQYCIIRTEPWESVHKMFYEALIMAGVDELKAKLMYAAVYIGGPRWDRITVISARSAFMEANPPHDGSGLFGDFDPGRAPSSKYFQGWTWEEYFEFQDQWIEDYIQRETRPTMNVITEEQRDTIVDFVIKKDPSIIEIEKYLNAMPLK